MYHEAVDGHASVLQSWSVAGLVPAPSEEHSLSETELPSRVHVTERDCVPPPHVSVQVPHDPVVHTAQLAVLQLLDVPGFDPGQPDPTHAVVQLESETVVVPCLHTTVLLWVPPPHVAEQVP